MRIELAVGDRGVVKVGKLCEMDVEIQSGVRQGW